MPIIYQPNAAASNDDLTMVDYFSGRETRNKIPIAGYILIYALDKNYTYEITYAKSYANLSNIFTLFQIRTAASRIKTVANHYTFLEKHSGAALAISAKNFAPNTPKFSCKRVCNEVALIVHQSSLITNHFTFHE